MSLERPPAPVPERLSHAALREAITVCRACDLWEGATQGLEAAGIPREDVYITNVVKHFRYKARGRRRIHQKPDRWQINACLPWLHAELEVVKLVVLVCLGATAAQALLGSQVRIGRDRGRPMDSELAELVTITTHPSAILRAEDADREAAMAEFVSDLRNVASWLSDRRAA